MNGQPASIAAKAYSELVGKTFDPRFERAEAEAFLKSLRPSHVTVVEH